MASEASRKKAEETLGHRDIFMLTSHVAARGVAIDIIAAALDEARAEGRAEALGDAIPLKDLMAEALAAARAEKAEQERDKLAEGYERRRQELDAQYAEIKKLQANLDAATFFADSLQARLDLHEAHDSACPCSGDGELHSYSCRDCTCGIGEEFREVLTRAEQAERERDDAKQYAEEYKKAYLSELDGIKLHMDTLQADLDAALVVCKALGVEFGRAWLTEETREAGKHVSALLEKRREENRG